MDQIKKIIRVDVLSVLTCSITLPSTIKLSQLCSGNEMLTHIILIPRVYGWKKKLVKICIFRKLMKKLNVCISKPCATYVSCSAAM